MKLEQNHEARRESGFALVLSLLVLTIVVVVVVQFQSSVAVEQAVAGNQAADERASLAARGAVFQFMAQLIADELGEYTINEYDLTDADTYAEPYLDEQAASSREVATTGDGTDSGGGLSGASFGSSFGANESGQGAGLAVSYTVVDLERRFNLNWLLVEDEGFRKHAEESLKRLVQYIGHSEEFGTKLVEFIQGTQEASGASTGSAATPSPNASPSTGTSAEEGAVPPRALLSLDELFNIEFENIDAILTGTDENGEPVAGTKPLLDFLTVWPTPGINVNTALPELLAAWLPDRDQRRPQPQPFGKDRRIAAAKALVVYRPHVEGDENFEVEAEDAAGATGATEGSEAGTEPAEPTEGTGTETSTEEGATEGSTFVGTGPLKRLADFAKPQPLQFVFSAQAGSGPGGGGGPGGGAAPAGAQAQGLKNWYDVLRFRSRLFKLTITVSAGADDPKVFEAVVFRGQANQDTATDSVVLELREVED